MVGVSPIFIDRFSYDVGVALDKSNPIDLTTPRLAVAYFAIELLVPFS